MTGKPNLGDNINDALAEGGLSHFAQVVKLNKMLDINGHPLGPGDYAQLLVRIEEIRHDGIRVRLANSDMELLVGFRNDEALGGHVADSELVFLAPADQADAN